jgi:YHS domain-containing protein
MLTNRIKLALGIISLPIAMMATSVHASDEHNTVPGLTYAGAPLGLHGVDPVAFIAIGNRIDGTDKYTGVHQGVAYYFASEENLNTFKNSPSKFVPEYGGFCAFGASVGKKFDGDPRYAAIYDNKLYVFLNEAVLKEFHKDPKGTITKANQNWSKIQHKAAASL